MYLRAPSPRQCVALTLGLASIWTAGIALAGSPRTGQTRQSSKSSVTAKSTATPSPDANALADIPTIDVLTGLRNGSLAADAKGKGDGRIILSVKNRTSHPLRVVLPPGLIASGASGQFGGMGGMGGGMGGMMGGMGGGMGGMGGGMMGGMGGMGGGMMGGMGGGMGGMRGGMGGGMRGGGMGGGTMPATMGMMMLGRLIMSLVGEKDSWNFSSLMMGMMGMRGGMMGGMGGMGGGMGGMMGGMGGGFRSVPPTGLPEVVVQPGHTRHLPTNVVKMNGPEAASSTGVSLPEKDEPLQIVDVADLRMNARLAPALKRLAAEKAPPTVAQLVMWKLCSDLPWEELARWAKPWANVREVALAQGVVSRLNKEERGPGQLVADSGRFRWSFQSKDSVVAERFAALGAVLKDRTVLGLKTEAGIPTQPERNSLAIEGRLKGNGTNAMLDVRLAASDPGHGRWVPVGRLEVSLTDAKGKDRDALALADALADAVLGQLVQAKLGKGPRVHGKETFKIKLLNASSLVLNGLALAGAAAEGETPAMPSFLGGLNIPPGKSYTVPATADLVERMHLKGGIHVIAADLSAL